jgi:hypothetical protein
MVRWGVASRAASRPYLHVEWRASESTRAPIDRSPGGRLAPGASDRRLGAPHARPGARARSMVRRSARDHASRRLGGSDGADGERVERSDAEARRVPELRPRARRAERVEPNAWSRTRGAGRRPSDISVGDDLHRRARAEPLVAAPGPQVAGAAGQNLGLFGRGKLVGSERLALAAREVQRPRATPAANVEAMDRRDGARPIVRRSRRRVRS